MKKEYYFASRFSPATLRRFAKEEGLGSLPGVFILESMKNKTIVLFL